MNKFSIFISAMKKFQFVLFALVLFAACTEAPKKPIVWKSIEKDLQAQFIMAQDGDVIELPEGNYMFTRTLSMDGKSNITIRGKGMDKTIFSWKNQTEGAQGMQISNGKILCWKIFQEDAKGNPKVNDTDGIVLRRIRSVWADIWNKTEPMPYPVLCKNVLMEECIAMAHRMPAFMWGNRFRHPQ